MAREITGFSNPLVKRVRSLREKKYRKAEGLFLAEGLRLHWGFGLALLSAVAVWVTQTRTTLGFEISASGVGEILKDFAQG
mgnify:CR=1 FL=1